MTGRKQGRNEGDCDSFLQGVEPALLGLKESLAPLMACMQLASLIS